MSVGVVIGLVGMFVVIGSGFDEALEDWWYAGKCRRFVAECRANDPDPDWAVREALKYWRQEVRNSGEDGVGKKADE